MPHLKVKRHCRLLVLLAVLVVGIVVGAGDQPIIAYRGQDAGEPAGAFHEQTGGLAGLLDAVVGNLSTPASADGSSATNLR